MKFSGFNTKSIHTEQVEPVTGAIVQPIFLTATYEQTQNNEPKYFYSRGENPTRFILENTIASLDNANYGLAFSSGQAAGLAVLSLLHPGDTVLSGNDIYGGTYNLFALMKEQNINIEFFDTDNLEAMQAQIKDSTRLIWIETPTNPLLKITDIEAVSKIAHRKGIKVLIDNTFLTSYLQNPLGFNADFALQYNSPLNVAKNVSLRSKYQYYKRQKISILHSNAVLYDNSVDATQKGVAGVLIREIDHLHNPVSIPG